MTQSIQSYQAVVFTAAAVSHPSIAKTCFSLLLYVPASVSFNQLLKEKKDRNHFPSLCLIYLQVRQVMSLDVTPQSNAGGQMYAHYNVSFLPSDCFI